MRIFKCTVYCNVTNSVPLINFVPFITRGYQCTAGNCGVGLKF